MGHALKTLWCNYATVVQQSIAEEKDLISNNKEFNVKKLEKNGSYIMWDNKNYEYCWYSKNTSL